MENRKTVVAAAFANPVDRKLMTGYLSGLGYDPVEFPVDDVPQADLFLLDVPSARRFGRQVMARKQADEVFLPAMIALGSRDPVAPWLAAGFDNALRLPLTKAALKADIELLLKLRSYSRELLERGEGKYRAIFETTGSATILVDEDTTILAANRECFRITGYRPEELAGTKWTDYVAPDSLETMLRYHRARRETPEEIPSQYEARLVDKAGRIRTVFLSVGMVPGAKRSIVSMVDITEQRAAEEEIARIAREWQATFDACNDVIWILDRENRVLRSNKVAERYFQRPCGEIVGKRCWEIVHGTKEPVPECPFLRAKHSLGRETMDLQIGERWFQIAVDPVFDAQGRYNGAVHIVSDITGRKHAEAERRKLEEQLNQAQKVEAIGRLAGGVAHDFNNMLSVILGYGESMLEMLHHADPLREDMKAIIEAGKRSADLTRQLLAFSRKQTLQPESLNLNIVVRNLEKMLRRLIGEDIDMEISLSDDIYRVMADPVQIEQVIMNLAVNARDAMPGGGMMTIETANAELDEAYARNHRGVKPGKYVLLSITDTGCGMDPETASQIFDPFFTTKEQGKGTGLGLSTVYGIVKQSGGNIWVYSEPGHGTTFKIHLPRTEAEPEKKQECIAMEATSGGVHILVVEDEESLRKLAHEILSRLGYQVTAAANGGEALLLVEEKGLKPDLVITDVVMPHMNGRELADRLRKSQPELKVLFMSGYTDNAIVHQGVLDRGVPFIQKPFSLKEIAAKVEAVLRGEGDVT